MIQDMDGEIDLYSVLDFAVFHTTVNHNRFDATVCSKGKSENIASGCLDILALHLPQAKDVLSNRLNDSFKLELVGKTKNLSWFTKSTAFSFLCLVNSPELLRSIDSIQNEIFQLEDIRKCHLALYEEDLQNHSSGFVAAEVSPITEAFKDNHVGSTETADSTKNDLLLAIERRLGALRQAFYSTLSQGLGAAASTRVISDVSAFCQYFGAIEMGHSLLRYLELISGKHISNGQSVHWSGIFNNRGETTENRTSQSCLPSCPVQCANTSETVGAPKARDDRHSQTNGSHPPKRSGSQRRSGSPICRIQIGRSRSRRSQATSIKTLGYGEAMQEDQSSNGLKNVLGDATSTSNKPDLRRWSAGMCDYSTSKGELERESDATQILSKMMESQPSMVNEETSGEKRGDFYSQYKEKRDQKLRSETASKRRAEKELQFRMMQEALDQRREEMGFPEKADSRRNSCPPALPQKVHSKSTVSNKSMPKLSSSPSAPRPPAKVTKNRRETKNQNAQGSSRVSRNGSNEALTKVAATKKSSAVVPVESKPFLTKGSQLSLSAEQVFIQSTPHNDENLEALADHSTDDQTAENPPPEKTQLEEGSGVSPRSMEEDRETGQTEKGVVEWGNHERPPVLVFHKKPSKGLRRFFMFGQRRKDSRDVLPQSTPFVHEEGARGRGACAASDLPSAETSEGGNQQLLNPPELRERNVSSAVVSVKATRFLFSLSTFRRSRSRETKLRLCGIH